MAGFGYRRLNSDRSQLQEIFLEPYLQAFRSFFTPLSARFAILVWYCWIEKGAFAPRASRWRIAGAGNHRQFRCCCPLETPETG